MNVGTGNADGIDDVDEVPEITAPHFEAAMREAEARDDQGRSGEQRSQHRQRQREPPRAAGQARALKASLKAQERGKKSPEREGQLQPAQAHEALRRQAMRQEQNALTSSVELSPSGQGADEEAAAPISTSATQQSSLPVAWQRAGLTERPRDTHSAPRPEEGASSQTLTEADDAAMQAIELRSGGAPPPVLPSVSSEDLGQAERTV